MAAKWVLAIAAALMLGTISAYADDVDEDDTSSSLLARSSFLARFWLTQRVADAHAQLGEVLSPLSSVPSLIGDIVAYSGIDAWRHGGSAYAGADWTKGIFALRLFAAGGVDQFRTPTDMYVSATARASLLPGVRFQIGRLDIKLLAGGDYMLRAPLLPYLDPMTEKFGARLSLDSWWQPADKWMLSGAVSATTIERGISGRLASGWRSPLAWIGPEVLATHDVYATQFRAGAHITGFRLGFAEWSVAGGYARDSFGREGQYGRFSLTVRPPPPEAF